MSPRLEGGARAPGPTTTAGAATRVAVDAETLMMEAMSALEAVQSRGALGRCRQAHADREERVKAARAAIARAARRRKQGGFWRKLAKTAVTVGKVAAIAAAVVAAPATGGSTLLVAVAIAGASLSLGAAAMRHFKVNADLGDVTLFKHRFDVKLTGVMDTTGMVAMGVATAGASGAGSAAGATATTAQTVSRAISVAAAGVQCASDVASGVSAVRLGHIEAAALSLDAQSVRHQADARQAETRARDEQELWKDLQDSYTRARAALSASLEARHHATDTIGRVRA